MEPLRVLFADDHIPDTGILSEEIPAYYRTFVEREFALSPYTNEFRDVALAGFSVLRRAVEALTGPEFLITPANHHAQAKKFVESQHFDIAIIDLNWAMDTKLKLGDRVEAGWQISRALDAADTRECRKTLQIIYSSNLLKRTSSILDDVARAEKLPVLKHLQDDRPATQLAIDTLRAAVLFRAAQIRATPLTTHFAIERQRKMSELASISLASLRTWSRLAPALVALAILTIIGAVALAVSGRADVNVVSAAAGVLVTVFSGLLFAGWTAVRKEAKELRVSLNKDFEEGSRPVTESEGDTTHS